VDSTLHLSSSEELLLPLRWIAVLRGRLRASLAATTGVHSAEDILKMLLVGADVVMIASALLLHGPGHLATVLEGVESWMSERGYASVDELRGSMSQEHVPNPVAFARANYARLVTSFVSPYDWRMAPQDGELRA
jgi:dihydroorotate dehydrogenase (fumarate)